MNKDKNEYSILIKSLSKETLYIFNYILEIFRTVISIYLKLNYYKFNEKAIVF